MMGVYCGGTSGAHLNPAVTLANCVFRGFSWRKLPIYIIAQTLGAMVACLIVYGNNTSAIDLFEGGAGIRTVGLPTSTGGIFATYPLDFLTKGGQFYDEFVGTALLLFCLYALLDDGNIGAGNLTPLGLFIIVYGIGSSFGSNTCYAINPARDFGPRLMTYALGYGSDVWTAGDYYVWVSDMCFDISADVNFHIRFRLLHLSSALSLAGSSTIPLSTLERVLSTRHLWASRVSLR